MTGIAGVDGVAELQPGGVDEPDDVAGEGLLDRLAVGPNAVVAYFVVSSRPVRSHVTVMPRSKRPEQMRANASRSRCDGVHVRLHLEHERRERAVEWAGGAVDVEPRRRWRGEVDHGVEDHAHAEVRERRADEHGRRVAGEERGHVDVGADRVEQGDLVDRRAPRRAFLGGRHLVGHDLLRCERRRHGRCG